MKNSFNKLTVLFIAFMALSNIAFCETDFTKAVKTCEQYSQTGSAKYKDETFNIDISLNKIKGDLCQYKEKIYQGKDYEVLICSFTKSQLEFIADSMDRFTKEFSKEISQNRIFEAKLTTNGEVFKKYLANPKICRIEHSKKK